MTSLHGERAINTSAAGGPGQPTAAIRHWTGWPPVPPGRRSPLCGDAAPSMVVFGQVKEMGATLPIYQERGERSMNYDPELAALLSQPWSNDACRGYVIAAMERCGFKPSDIEQVMVELYEVFDYTTLQEAEAYYERSPY